MKKHRAGLATALAENQLVDWLYRKSIDEYRLDGYVVSLSDGAGFCFMS